MVDPIIPWYGILSWGPCGNNNRFNTVNCQRTISMQSTHISFKCGCLMVLDFNKKVAGSKKNLQGNIYIYIYYICYIPGLQVNINSRLGGDLSPYPSLNCSPGSIVQFRGRLSTRTAIVPPRHRLPASTSPKQCWLNLSFDTTPGTRSSTICSCKWMSFWRTIAN